MKFRPGCGSGIWMAEDQIICILDWGRTTAWQFSNYIPVARIKNNVPGAQPSKTKVRLGMGDNKISWGQRRVLFITTNRVAAWQFRIGGGDKDEASAEQGERNRRILSLNVKGHGLSSFITPGKQWRNLGSSCSHYRTFAFGSLLTNFRRHEQIFRTPGGIELHDRAKRR